MFEECNNGVMWRGNTFSGRCLMRKMLFKEEKCSVIVVPGGKCSVIVVQVKTCSVILVQGGKYSRR